MEIVAPLLSRFLVISAMAETAEREEADQMDPRRTETQPSHGEPAEWPVSIIGADLSEKHTDKTHRKPIQNIFRL